MGEGGQIEGDRLRTLAERSEGEELEGSKIYLQHSQYRLQDVSQKEGFGRAMLQHTTPPHVYDGHDSFPRRTRVTHMTSVMENVPDGLHTEKALASLFRLNRGFQSSFLLDRPYSTANRTQVLPFIDCTVEPSKRVKETFFLLFEVPYNSLDARSHALRFERHVHVISRRISHCSSISGLYYSRCLKRLLRLPQIVSPQRGCPDVPQIAHRILL